MDTNPEPYQNSCVNVWPIFKDLHLAGENQGTSGSFSQASQSVTLLLCHKQERKTTLKSYIRLTLFSFIIMPRNSQVRGLCNPVVDSSLLDSMLNYHLLCFLT